MIAKSYIQRRLYNRLSWRWNPLSEESYYLFWRG